MKIETKYDIGQRIWVACEENGKLKAYEDTIIAIVVEAGNTISYTLEKTFEDVAEEDIIPSEDKIEEKFIEIVMKKIVGEYYDKRS